MISRLRRAGWCRVMSGRSRAWVAVLVALSIAPKLQVARAQGPGFRPGQRTDVDIMKIALVAVPRHGEHEAHEGR